MVNGNCHYVQEGDTFAIWMCEDNWWVGELSYKGQCNGTAYASKDSKPNVHVQDDSLQWKWVYDDSEVDVKLKCVDLCL